ncbi:MAG: GNAT family N-acetyltransferase [Bilophila wadsworthia]
MKTAAASARCSSPRYPWRSMRAKGIGAALIREALAKAAALGHSSAVLIGDPGYYGRFGFHSAASISYPGVPGEYTLACELTPGALRNISGAIALPDC